MSCAHCCLQVGDLMLISGPWRSRVHKHKQLMLWMCRMWRLRLRTNRMKETEIHLLGYLWHMILVRDKKKMGRRSSCLFIYLKLYSVLQLHEAYIYIYIYMSMHTLILSGCTFSKLRFHTSVTLLFRCTEIWCILEKD